MILTFKLPFTNLLAAETFIDVSVVINLILLIATDYVDRYISLIKLMVCINLIKQILSEIIEKISTFS